MGKTKGMNKTDVLSASEIGQYQYCSCAWILQRCGYEPESPALNEGKRFHVTLGETLDGFQRKNRLARWIALSGLLLVFLAVFLFFIEVIL
jgi:hypothetical protein